MRFLVPGCDELETNLTSSGTPAPTPMQLIHFDPAAASSSPIRHAAPPSGSTEEPPAYRLLFEGNVRPAALTGE